MHAPRFPLRFADRFALRLAATAKLSCVVALLMTAGNLLAAPKTAPTAATPASPSATSTPPAPTKPPEKRPLLQRLNDAADAALTSARLTTRPLAHEPQMMMPVMGYHPLNQQKWILLSHLGENPDANNGQLWRIEVLDPQWVDPFGLDRKRIVYSATLAPVGDPSRGLYQADVSALTMDGVYEAILYRGREERLRRPLVIDRGAYWKLMQPAAQGLYYFQMGTPLVVPLPTSYGNASPRKPFQLNERWTQQAFSVTLGRQLLAPVPDAAFWCPITPPRNPNVLVCEPPEDKLTDTVLWGLMAYNLAPDVMKRLTMGFSPAQKLNAKMPDLLHVLTVGLTQMTAFPHPTRPTQLALARGIADIQPFDKGLALDLRNKSGVAPSEVLSGPVNWSDILLPENLTASKAFEFLAQWDAQRFAMGEDDGFIEPAPGQTAPMVERDTQTSHQALLNALTIGGLSLLAQLHTHATGEDLGYEVVSRESFRKRLQLLLAGIDSLLGGNQRQLSYVAPWGEDWPERDSRRQPGLRYVVRPECMPLSNFLEAPLPGLLTAGPSVASLQQQPGTIPPSCTPYQTSLRDQAQWLFVLSLANQLVNNADTAMEAGLKLKRRGRLKQQVRTLRNRLGV